MSRGNFTQRYSVDDIQVGDTVYIQHMIDGRDEWDRVPWEVTSIDTAPKKQGQAVAMIETLTIARANEVRSILATPAWVQTSLPKQVLFTMECPLHSRVIMDDPPDSVLPDGTHIWHL